MTVGKTADSETQTPSHLVKGVSSAQEWWNVYSRKVLPGLIEGWPHPYTPIERERRKKGRSSSCYSTGSGGADGTGAGAYLWPSKNLSFAVSQSERWKTTGLRSPKRWRRRRPGPSNSNLRLWPDCLAPERKEKQCDRTGRGKSWCQITRFVSKKESTTLALTVCLEVKRGAGIKLVRWSKLLQPENDAVLVCLLFKSYFTTILVWFHIKCFSFQTSPEVHSTCAGRLCDRQTCRTAALEG